MDGVQNGAVFSNESGRSCEIIFAVKDTFCHFLTGNASLKVFKVYFSDLFAFE